tara:strand:- start:7947 stop:8648 length:702 start_codon:yes stop_codon:yes gene_type:complete
MNISKQLKEGPGYAVFKIENMRSFEKIRNSFIKKIFNKNSSRNINNLRKSLTKMNKAEINNTMIKLLSFTNLSEMIVSSCPKLINKLCGKNLFIQRRAHIIINVPGSGQAKQWPHYEMISGLSPFSYVIWAPLHDLDDDGGIYYIDQHKSSKIMKKEETKGLVNGPDVLNLMQKQKPVKIKYGEAIIFNPFVIHGNTPFKSKYARIACNVRFQSCNRPLLQKNSDYLKYYKLD